jgi:hypothetical protein
VIAQPWCTWYIEGFSYKVEELVREREVAYLKQCISLQELGRGKSSGEAERHVMI